MKETCLQRIFETERRIKLEHVTKMKNGTQRIFEKPFGRLGTFFIQFCEQLEENTGAEKGRDRKTYDGCLHPQEKGKMLSRF
jgi:hypothetical protein